MRPLQLAFALAIFAGAALGWVLYFRWKDHKHPEPRWLLAVTMVAGALATLPALLFYSAFDELGIHATWNVLATGRAREALTAALAVGASEETAKLLAVLPIALFSRHFDELLDGFVYAGCAGLGFAAAESAALFALGDLSTGGGLARAVAAPITHALFSAPWGYGLAILILKRRKVSPPWPKGSLGGFGQFVVGGGLGVVAHGLYDLALAREEQGMASLSALVILALWMWFIRTARRLERVPPVDRAN